MNLLNFDNETDNFHVRTATLDGAALFVAQDVCKALGISKYRDAISKLDIDERMSVLVDTLGGRQSMVCVTESGLYALIFQSRKPSAKRFRKWVTSVVLPAIREHGFFSVFGSEADAQQARLHSRVAGQMSHVRRSVEALGEPLPHAYGTIAQFLKSFGIEVETPAERLRIISAVRKKAREEKAITFPVWSCQSWRGVTHYPREIVRSALFETMPERVEPDLFETPLLPSTPAA